MDWDYKDIYAYSVMRIKEKINVNYGLQERYPDQKEFYKGAIFGLFECLDMMKSDVIIRRNEEAIKEMGLDFEIFEKYKSGTLFSGYSTLKDYFSDDEINSLDDVDDLDDDDDLDDEEDN